ncbi:sigma-70 family RNA polymerase sigma factor [Candidatus Woesearchaeota archaeon]|nr:sigma-70 family RNA polymerase sigma factor [Candidatus Woesearchaeota archaeon]
MELSTLLSCALKHIILPEDEIRDLIARAQNNDVNAKNKIIESNIKVIVKIAKKHAKNGNIEDLVSEGVIGATRAIYKFELSRTTKFITYADYWIEQEIKRYARGDETVRAKPHRYEAIDRIDKIIARYFAKNGKDPSPKYIAYILRRKTGKKKYDEAYVERALKYRFQVFYIEDHLALDKNKELPDESSDSPEDLVVRSNLNNVMYGAMQKLNLSELDVLLKRYGLFGFEPRTFEAIGNERHRTRERMRQIEVKALSKLRAAMKKIPPG